MLRAAVALALLALTTACGVVSRESMLRPELRDAKDDEDLRALRGADPLVALTWLVSASSAPDPESALAIVERGLQYLPGQPDLTWLRLSLLAQLGRRDEELDVAASSLGRGPPGALVPELISFRLYGRLSQDDVRGAEEAALALGGVASDDSRSVSTAWIAIALRHELLGNLDDADAAADLSLASGPRGMLELRQMAGLDPTRVEAATALVRRADERHPDQPDLRIFLAIQSLLNGHFDEARRQLDDLPEPLPSRLVPDREALYARIDLLQDRVPAALTRLRDRLDADPSETGSLAVLLECWRQHGQPPDAEMKLRLQAALRRFADPALTGALQAALQDIDARAGQAAPAAPKP